MNKDSVLTFEELEKSLVEKSYATVPFPIDRPTIESAIEAFFKFLEEPDSVKEHIQFSISPLHRRGDVGYVHRDASDHIYNDDKEFFHFNPALFERYGDFLDAHPVVMDFMMKAKPIWEAAYQTAKDILQTFEPEFPGICDKVFDTKDVHVQLRFLRYKWQNSGEFLAKPHFDAGSFTLAIAESCPGLRIGSCPENLTPVEHQSGTAIFMLSSNYQKVMNTDKLSPGWHDVIQVDKSQIGKPYARWAVVTFIDAHGVEALSRAETHKWYVPKVA